MALSETQKAQIRQYLGYTDLFRYKNTRLEGVLNGNLSAEAETLVVVSLTKLAAIDDALTSAAGAAVSSAGVKKVDEIEFFGEGATTTTELARIGRTLIGRISITLGVPPYGDYFGSRGWPGDAYSELGGLGPGNRGGGLIPLG